ncbi:MAG TPA: EF-P lysine aminoacylase EpmA [Candidatus Magasanikbacteria bacterium]|nr:EF-P lysine aminoacylase EpmA [Candidatus Magasanikbacteria bacterium]
MEHVNHIINNKKYLDLRFALVRQIREFFWGAGFVEVDAPAILRFPGQEPYLSPMRVGFHDEKKTEFTGYLHTSPEYTMKKMLAAGYEKIFYLGKCFRDQESFGGTHNPEFTMMEWYRAGADFYALMDDTENLVKKLVEYLRANKSVGELDNEQEKILQRLGGGWQRFHMREVWQKYAGVNLDKYLTTEKMFELCLEKGYKPDKNEAYDDLFYRIFLNEIEPKLGQEIPTIVHHYPIQMAALSRVSDEDSRYAERFEVYAEGVELANAFSELTDAKEQSKRLEEERKLRMQSGNIVYDVDREFIDAVSCMPQSAGIALGVDRLIMALLGCKNIDNVLTLPASKLFKE